MKNALNALNKFGDDNEGISTIANIRQDDSIDSKSN